mmetsp:Transcript_7075/g.8520  ORF Transcript_7075/g.8520 Transcript_7075/m.8520 type:complete len:114 (+) Transcript_7075:803-1144(+)
MFRSGQSQAPQQDTREDKTMLMQYLETFDAQEVDMKPIMDQSGKDKLRVLFHINDKQKAKALYDMISLHGQKYLENSDLVMQIYFLLPEKTFEEYADMAAKKFYEDEEQRVKE